MMYLQINLPLQLQNRLAVMQRIDFAALQSFPDQALQAVAETIIEKPESIEQILTHPSSGKGEYPALSRRIQAVCSGIKRDGIGNSRPQDGLIGSPDIRPLEDALAESTAEVNVDVIFSGRKNQKPDIYFSKYLSGPMPILQMEVDAAVYPHTASLLKAIRSFDSWKREILRKAYVAIGEKQREFFEYLNPVHWNVFNQADLAGELSVHSTTVNRLLANRFVTGKSVENRELILASKDLLPTKDKVQKYTLVSKLNEILKGELETKTAYSDEEIAAVVPHLVRRTLTKYRGQSQVSGWKERQQAYDSGQQTPFQLRYF